MLRTTRFLPAVALTLLATSATAAPTQRKQQNQHGDFLLIGNTLGYDCANGTPAPVVGTVGACGNNTSDTSPDVYWRSESPGAGQAAANTSIKTADARSTAVLSVLAGATVTYARLYWGAQAPGTTADEEVTLDRPGGTSKAIVADVSNTSTYKGPSDPTHTYYQSSAEVTDFVQAHGSGAYRVGGVDANNFVNTNNDTVFAGWYLVVFYQLDSDPPRNLTLFDGLDLIGQNTSITTTIQGFLVPNAGFDAKLGVVSWEGDNAYSGDYMQFNGNTLSGSLNPADNFFNGTRTWLGTAVSNVGDLPQLNGKAGSQSGVDFDVIDVKPYLQSGDTSATVKAGSQTDVYWLGAFVTSISTFAPDFSSTAKTVEDLNGGDLRPGDVLEYTIVAKNTGNDQAVDVVLTDALPHGITFRPGSIRITAGAQAGTKTDASGDDQGEYVAATRTVTVRLGDGADGTTGGKMAIGATATIKFQVTVDADASGTIVNQAVVTASGDQGAPPTPFPSDKDGNGTGVPTPAAVDECASDAECAAPKPFCLTSASPKVCVACNATGTCGCAVDADCAATEFCDTGVATCTAKLPNGASIPTIDGHAPSLDGACTDTVGAAVCASGACDAQDDRCGFANGHGPCDAANADVCRSAVCGGDALCGLPDGDGPCDAANEGTVCRSETCDEAASVCTPPPPCTVDAECASDRYCDGAVCKRKLPNGEPVPTVPGHAPPIDGTCTDTAGTAVCASGVCDTSDDACGYANGQGPCDATSGATVCRSTHCAAGGTNEGTCVACLTDGDCPAGTPLCDTSVGACTIACTTDVDCGTADSGRVCTDATKLCADGCRGAGGNGCPTGLTCSSTTTAIGACESPLDGGTGDGASDGGLADGAADDGGDAGGDASADATSDGAAADADDDDGSLVAELDDAGALEGGGCGCEAVGSNGHTSATGLVAVGLALALARRRRRG